jgi:protein SCO1/2
VRWAAALLGAIAAAGCRGTATADGDDLHGVFLPRASPRPDFTLRRVDGRTFEFREVTRGWLTFLFFGYSNCPDVCPATMANLGAVMSRLTPTERRRIDVVFVTTDPARDTGAVLEGWLRRHDPEAIALTGSESDVTAAQLAAGVSPAVRDPPGSEAYTVSHAAQVIVVSPDDSVHVTYPFGTRQSEWADDLRRLLTRWPAGPP